MGDGKLETDFVRPNNVFTSLKNKKEKLHVDMYVNIKFIIGIQFWVKKIDIY